MHSSKSEEEGDVLQKEDVYKFRYEKSQEIGHVGNWEYDVNTKEFWGSKEAKRIYGFNLTTDTFTTKEVENCIPEKKKVHQALVDLIEKNKPYDIEFEINPYNTEAKKYIKSVADITDYKDGKPSKIMGVIQDITKEKQIRDKLRESEEMFRKSIINAPYPIMIHAEDGEVILINKIWTDLSGYAKSDIPTIKEWSRKAYGEEHNFAKEFIDKLYQLDDVQYDGEWEINTNDNNTLVWDFYSTPIGRGSKNRRLIISTALDITKRKEAEKETKEKITELEKINKMTIDRELKMIELKDKNKKLKNILDKRNISY